MRKDYTGAVGGGGGMVSQARARETMASNFHMMQLSQGRLMQDSNARVFIRKLMQAKNITEEEALDELMNTKQGQGIRDAAMFANSQRVLGHGNYQDESRFAMDVFSRGGVTANMFDGGGRLVGVNQQSYGSGTVATQAAAAYLRQVDSYFGDNDKMGNMSKTDFLENSGLLAERGALGLRTTMRKHDLSTDNGVRKAMIAASASGNYAPDVAHKLKGVETVEQLNELKQQVSGAGDAKSQKLKKALDEMGQFRSLGVDTASMAKAAENIKSLGTAMDHIKDIYTEITNNRERFDKIESITGIRVTGAKQMHEANRVLQEQQGAANSQGITVREQHDDNARFGAEYNHYVKGQQGRRAGVSKNRTEGINKAVSNHISNDIGHQLKLLKSNAKALGLDGVDITKGDLEKRATERSEAFRNKTYLGINSAMAIHHSGAADGNGVDQKRFQEGYREMRRLLRTGTSEGRRAAEIIGNEIGSPFRDGATSEHFVKNSEMFNNMAKNPAYARDIARVSSRAYDATKRTQDIYSDATISEFVKKGDREFLRESTLGYRRGLGNDGMQQVISMSDQVDKGTMKESGLHAEVRKRTKSLGYGDAQTERLIKLLSGDSRGDTVSAMRKISTALHRSPEAGTQSAGDRAKLDNIKYEEDLAASSLHLEEGSKITFKGLVRALTSGNTKVGDNTDTATALAAAGYDQEELEYSDDGYHGRFKSARAHRKRRQAYAKQNDYIAGVNLDANGSISAKEYRKMMRIAGGDKSLHEMRGISEEEMLEQIQGGHGKGELLNYLKEHGVGHTKTKNGHFLLQTKSEKGKIYAKASQELETGGLLDHYIRGDKLGKDITAEENASFAKSKARFRVGKIASAEYTRGIHAAKGKSYGKNSKTVGHRMSYQGHKLELANMMVSEDPKKRRQAFKLMRGMAGGADGVIEDLEDMSKSITGKYKDGGFTSFDLGGRAGSVGTYTNGSYEKTMEKLSDYIEAIQDAKAKKEEDEKKELENVIIKNVTVAGSINATQGITKVAND